MLYARKNIKKNNVQMYILLLNDFISDNNDKVKPLFVSLYEDTKAIITKDKTFYTIKNRDFVPLVAYLVNNHSDYFKNIDLKELDKDKEHFSQLRSYLEKAAISI